MNKSQACQKGHARSQLDPEIEEVAWPKIHRLFTAGHHDRLQVAMLHVFQHAQPGLLLQRDSFDRDLCEGRVHAPHTVVW